jgi:hypothetical protein
MTLLRKRLVAGGALAFAAMGAFPPWVLNTPAVEFKAGMVYPSTHEDLGYAPIFLPPQRPDWVRPPVIHPAPQDPQRHAEEALLAKTHREVMRSAELDWLRLSVQWLSVVVLCAGGYAISGEINR